MFLYFFISGALWNYGPPRRSNFRFVEGCSRGGAVGKLRKSYAHEAKQAGPTADLFGRFGVRHVRVPASRCGLCAPLARVKKSQFRFPTSVEIFCPQSMELALMYFRDPSFDPTRATGLFRDRHKPIQPGMRVVLFVRAIPDFILRRERGHGAIPFPCAKPSGNREKFDFAKKHT